VAKGTGSPGAGSLRAGVYTAASMLLVSGVAAAVGVVIAREFGRTHETDGLLAAYGVFIVIAIAAQAIRVAVLPELSRAREERRLAGEVAGYVLALTVVALPLVLVAELGASAFGSVLTGGESEVARTTAADALQWMVPAAVAYLFAGVAASALAALDDYGTAAVGYAVGSAAGFTLIVLRAEPDGITAVAWGMALNASIALVVPVLALVARAARAAMPPIAARPSGVPLRARLRSFAVSASLPLALQLLYVVCLPFAARIGTGAATSFVYAYLAAASLVAVAAASLGLATSVPLARRGLEPKATTAHIVSASWLALTLVGAAAGIFALAGGDVVEAVLGGSYGGDVGADVGRLVVVLSPWMVASVGVSVTFPLAFVVGRTRLLPWIALAALAIELPLAWIGSELLDLDGLAASLAVATFVVLVALLHELHVLREALRGVLVAGGIVGAVAAVSFSAGALVPGSLMSAAVGALAYVALLALLRPRGLGMSWRYLRALG
jgi:O-antigen/teichoic acid export membrane protein